MLRSAAVAVAVATILAGCANPPQGRSPYQPTADMTAVLLASAQLGTKPIEDLTPAQARVNPSIADAVRVVQAARGQTIAPELARTEEIQVQGAAGLLPARVYRPERAGTGPLPIILYFHGGGWVIADINTYDASARALANGTGAIVVSAEYRRGPESRFPAAHDDAVAIYRFMLEHASVLGGDPRRMAVAGESAGGNLAINVALAARNAGLPAPVHQLLVYPVAGTDLTAPSVREHASGTKPLNGETLEWFIKHYTANPQDVQDTRLNVLGVSDLSRLPPTTIVLAQIDPLRSGGELLGQRLQASGVPVATRTYPGITHEFFGTGAVVAEGRAAMDFATTRLKQTFDAIPVAMPASTAMRPAQRRTR